MEEMEKMEEKREGEEEDSIWVMVMSKNKIKNKKGR